MRYIDMLIHDIDELNKVYAKRDDVDNVSLKTDLYDNGNKGVLIIYAIPYTHEDLHWRRRMNEELLPFMIYQNGVDSQEVSIIHIRLNEKYTTPDIGLHDMYVDINDYIVDEELSDTDLCVERIYLAIRDKISSVLFKRYNVSHYDEDTFKLFIKIAMSKYKMSVKNGGK